MEAAEGAERRWREEPGGKNLAAAGAAGGAGGEAARGPPLSGTSYWLDLWLMILFDLVLLVVVYLLP